MLDNGLAPYVGYARSFGPVLGSDTTTDPANPRPFKPSSGQQTEGGVKFTSRDNRDVKLFGTVALFDAIVNYDTPGWRFAVNGSNIFDKLCVARRSGFVGCMYGAGARGIGTVTKKF